MHPGSVIPQQFELALENGGKIWVDGNATKHVAEYAAAKAINSTPEAVRLASQVQLESLGSAVNTAVQNGVTYRQVINVKEIARGQVLCFAFTPKNTGKTQDLTPHFRQQSEHRCDRRPRHWPKPGHPDQPGQCQPGRYAKAIQPERDYWEYLAGAEAAAPGSRLRDDYEDHHRGDHCDRRYVRCIDRHGRNGNSCCW